MTAGRVPDAGEFPRLLRRAKRGDETAWTTLYEWLAPQVIGFLRSTRLRDPEDVLGDVFLEVARRVETFKGDAIGFRAWVFTIARAKRVDDIRRRTIRPEDRLDTGEHAVLPARDDVEWEVLASLATSEIETLLSVLTTAQAEVVALKALAGLTAREIGEVTDRSTGAVEQLYHRAIARLHATVTSRKETSMTNDPPT